MTWCDDLRLYVNVINDLCLICCSLTIFLMIAFTNLVMVIVN